MDAISSLYREVQNKTLSATLPRDAVGHMITNKVPIITPDKNISDLREILFENAKKFDSIQYTYVLSKHGKLAGIISIKQVLSFSPESKIKNIMQTNIIKTHPKVDQEKAAQIAVKNGIKALPVVDENDYFLGTFLGDQILSVLDQESEEDLLKLSGIILGKSHLKEESQLPILKSFTHRVPWIIVGLFGGLFTAKIIGGFSATLEKNIILAGFIPLIAYVANAVGVQTQTIYIRDLSRYSNISIVKYSVKQLFTSSLIAIACWIVIYLLSMFIWKATFLGFVVGLSVFSAIMMATFFAIFIPYILVKLRVDPAIGSGPFATIIQDLLSIVIYFSIADLLL